MRFLQLSLIAYGPFSDRRIDLSGGSHGVHVIYGPNEAGKSTSLRAAIDLLFGIPAQTKDAHLHDPPALRVGGRLERSDGQQLALIRRKGIKQTLLASDETPLPDGALDPYLGGVTRELYTSMFGLDHARLVQGGGSLLAGEGQLGAALYGASLGVTGLHQIHQALLEQAEELFNPRGFKPRINQGVRRWQELQKRIHELSLLPQEWTRGEREVEELESRRAARVAERLELGARAARLVRARRARPKIARWRQLGDQLAAAAPELPEDGPELRRAALAALDEGRRAAERSRRQIAEIEGRLSGLGPRDPALDLEAEISSLKERVAEHRADLAALADLERERQRLERERASALEALGGIEPARPARTLRLRVSALAAQRGEIDAELGRRREAVAALERELGALEAQAAAEDPPAPEGLADVVAAARRDGDLEARRRELAAAKATQLRAVERALLALDRWDRGPAALAALALPSMETVERFGESFEAIARRAARADERRGELAKSSLELERQIEAIERQGAVPTEADLAAARGERDRRWTELKVKVAAGRRLTPAELEAFEQPMIAADEAADRLHREADRVTRFAQLLAGRTELARATELCAAEAAAITAEADRQQARWRAAWADTGVEAQSPKEMAGWLRRRERALEAIEALAAAELAERNVADKIELHRGRLLQTTGVGPAASLLELVLSGERRLAAVEERARSERERRARARAVAAQLEEQRQALGLAEEERARWDRAWREALHRLGTTEALTPQEGLALLEGADGVHAIAAELERVRGVMAAARERAARFAADLAAVEGAAGGLAGAPDVAADRAHRRLIEARAKEADRRGLEGQRAAARAALEEAERQITSAEARLGALMARARADTVEALERLEEEAAQQRAVLRERGELEAQLLEVGAGLDLSALIAETDGLSPDAIEPEIAGCEARLSEIDEEIAAIDRQLGARRQQIEPSGRDQAARAAEECQAAAAEIAALSHRFLLLRMSAALLEHQIERHRAEHAGPLLGRAGALLAQLTRGSLERLETALDGQSRPILLGVRPDGSRIDVTAMSEGTRDQLYLALRLASIERYLAQPGAEPLPVIVDDILLNFDDQRAQAALLAFGELSRRTQVLFFTHHARLVELASRVLPPEVCFVARLGPEPRPGEDARHELPN